MLKVLFYGERNLKNFTYVLKLDDTNLSKEIAQKIHHLEGVILIRIIRYLLIIRKLHLQFLPSQLL